MFKNRNSEIDSIKNIVAQQRPLQASEREKLKEYFRVGLTYSSNALEGNSLTETETKIILEDGLTIGGKSIREHLEVIGHSKAFDAMYELAPAKSVTEEDILMLHRLFYEGIDGLNAGIYRSARVFISGADHVFPLPVAVPGLMKLFIDQIPDQQATLHPVTFAAWLHAEFVNIHPFVDGNGRTARLLMNVALLQAGYVVTIILMLMRVHYLAALRTTNQENYEPFYNFISEMVHESHKEYKRLLGVM